MNYDDLPKIELHLHLDCSLSFEVVKKLKPSITIEDYERDFIAPANCASLQEYIKCAQASIEIMQTEEQLRLVTLDLFKQLKKDNVIYAEIRFAPLQHIRKELTAQQVVQVVDEACKAGIEETGVQAGIILCTLRNFSEEESMETVLLAEEFKGSRVVGFDIAADELLPVENHKKAFEYAHAHDIPCTAHCGEARGAESVWETLNGLNPSRIGHGVRSVEDEELVDFIIHNNIHLEICPTSNLQTGVYASMKEHVVDQIYRKGISMGINTDGRSLSNVTLKQEYESLNKFFGWDLSHFLRCNHSALDAAFIEDSAKAKLREKLVKGFEL
ncbi:MAG: adenosine deaminase [Balneolaceae bacterium]